MKLLRLGKGLTFPTHAVTETFAVLGVRGSGKSNAAAVMAEEMFKAELPFCVIDPVGSWWGLRSSADGKGPGLEIPIFGGPKGDVPLERRGGQLIADLIVDERLSCILDLRTLESEGGKKEFLVEFARRLYQRNEAPLHLFLEEADDYIPQRPMGNDEKFLLRAFENIVRRGRGRGLGMTMITQRSAAINKNVLTQAGTLIAFRTTGPRDRDAVLDWVKYHDQNLAIAEALPGLANGECWIWSPEFLGETFETKFRRRATFDSGQTPKLLKAMKRPARLADVDLAAVEKKMAATIERAKAEDPKALKRENAELRRRIEILQKQPSIRIQKAKVIKRPALTKGQQTVIEKAAEKIRKATAQLGPMADKLVMALQYPMRQEGESEFPLTFQLKKVGLPSDYAKIRGVRKEPLYSSKGHYRVKADDNGRLNPGEKAILTVLIQYPAGATQDQIAVLTGYKKSSRVTYLKNLREKGYAISQGNEHLATIEGIAALGGRAEPLPTGEALIDYWKQRLSPGEKKIFEVVLNAQEAISSSEIQEQTGYKKSSVVTYLKNLRARRLVDTERGMTTLAETLQ